MIISGKGEEKTASCTVTVKKNSPLITSFDASPNAIKAGESAVLNWHVAGASNVTIEPDIGVVEPVVHYLFLPQDYHIQAYGFQ